MNRMKGIALIFGALLSMLHSWSATSQQVAVTAATQNRVTVRIPPRPLREALRMFADQTHLQVIYRSEQIDAGVMSTDVSGTYSADEALARLLGALQLHAVRINARTLAIRKSSMERTHSKIDLVRAASPQVDQPDHE